jgi:hypothetical protein
MNPREKYFKHILADKCYALMKCMFLLLILINCFSCKVETKNSQIRSIDIEAGLENVKLVNLSQFGDTIQYIPLETKVGFELSNAFHCSYGYSHFLVSDVRNCILFSGTGEIIARIGTNGRGPGEYRGINQIEITPDRRILLKDFKTLLEYNFKGEFLGSYSSFQNLSKSGSAGRWISVNDSLLLAQVRNDSGNEYYKAAIINKFGKIRVGFKNYDFFLNERQGTSRLSNVSSVYKYFEYIGFKEVFNDTLFYLNHSGRAFEREYAFVKNMFETKEYIFFDLVGLCNSFKRSTPIQETIQTMSGQVVTRELWYYDTNPLMVYNKLTGESVLVDISRLEGEMFSRGFVNDIDGGPRFYPAFMLDETKLGMSVSASDLKRYVASESFQNAPAKYPERKKALEELANSLSEYDNPVLIVVTVK